MNNNTSFTKHSRQPIPSQKSGSQPPESPSVNNKAFGQIFSYFIKRNDAKSLFFNMQSTAKHPLSLLEDPEEKDLIKE